MDAAKPSEKNCTAYDPTHIEGQQTAIYVQLVLSLTLGVSAFFGFCVSRDHNNPKTLLMLADPTTKMEEFICSTQKTYRCRRQSARVAG